MINSKAPTAKVKKGYISELLIKEIYRSGGPWFTEDEIEENKEELSKQQDEEIWKTQCLLLKKAFKHKCAKLKSNKRNKIDFVEELEDTDVRLLKNVNKDLTSEEIKERTIELFSINLFKYGSMNFTQAYENHDIKNKYLDNIIGIELNISGYIEYFGDLYLNIKKERFEISVNTPYEQSFGFFKYNILIEKLFMYFFYILNRG